MTAHKDLKRLVRSRMAKTGESYTAARARIVATPSSRSKVKPDYATLAGMSDAAIEKNTGCTWEKWVGALDHAKAYDMKHRDIAELVHTKFKVRAWWTQAVTVGYERIKGLRDIGQRRGGLYEASRSKTVHVPVATLFKACADTKRRAAWLGDADYTVRKATAPKSLRMTWGDGTDVTLWFTDKGQDKSSVAVTHAKLPSRAAITEKKAFWGERLSALAASLP